MPLYVCRRWEGFVQPLDGQALKWVRPRTCRSYPMPPADTPLIPHLGESCWVERLDRTGRYRGRGLAPSARSARRFGIILERWSEHSHVGPITRLSMEATSELSRRSQSFAFGDISAALPLRARRRERAPTIWIF